jgi:HD-GYP domain-containing protein (c-di-GMP phosphodiesterase class II)
MEYTPIRINTVKPEKVISFDLYIFFKETYVLYLKNGLQLPKDKHKKLKKQKFAKFFITADDEQAYQVFLDDLLGQTLKDPNASVDEKVDVAQDAGMTAIDQMQANPSSEKSYKTTQKAAQGLIQLIQENPSALKKMFTESSDEHDQIVKHSLNVCLLSAKLAEELKIPEEEIVNLTTAALMHDIGLVQMDSEAAKLFKSPKAESSSKDKLNYKEHIDVTIKVLSEKPYINKQILDLITNHEENLAGTGPYKKSKLSLPEECLSLVNCYDKKIMASKITPKQALKELMVDEVGNYQLSTLKLFKKVLLHEGLVDE